MSIVMNVPVLPTPALHACETNDSNNEINDKK